MIPIGPIIWAAVAIARRGKGGGPGRAVSPGFVNATFRAALVLPLASLVVVLLAERSRLAAAFAAIPIFFVCFPAFSLRRFFVPLGLVRASYVLARISPPVAYALEPTANGAVFFSALAALRRAPSAERTAWLDAHLLRDRTVRAATMAAEALLAAARGRPETARLLFASIDALPTLTVPGAVREVARRWLIADAARRGDWRRVAVVGYRRGSIAPWPWLMGAVARRLLGDVRAPSDFTLRLLWLVAAHRRRTLPIVRRALATPRATAPRYDPVAPETGAAIDTALQAHAAFVRASSSASSEVPASVSEAPVAIVVASARAWDAVRGPASVAWLARRALSIGASMPAETAVERVLDRARLDLAPCTLALAPDVLTESEMLRDAAARARQSVLGAIEEAAGALAQRTARKQLLHVLDEWVEWTALRARCDDVLRTHGPEARRTIFSTVYPTACNYAVWLFNVRTEKLLAHSIFRWLLVEARQLGDEAAQKLLRKNVACGHGG